MNFQIHLQEINSDLEIGKKTFSHTAFKLIKNKSLEKLGESVKF